jgi:hypothetical protein
VAAAEEVAAVPGKAATYAKEKAVAAAEEVAAVPGKAATYAKEKAVATAEEIKAAPGRATASVVRTVDTQLTNVATKLGMTYPPANAASDPAPDAVLSEVTDS